MARKRMLSPDFFISTGLNQLPVTAMVTFAGLWTYADDWGRGEDDVTLIKAAIWPRRKSHSEAKIAADLAGLEAGGYICRYFIGPFQLLHIPSWHEHQQISHRGKPKVPPCSKHEPGLYADYLRDDDSRLAKFRRSSGNPPETFQDSVVEVNTDESSSSEVGPKMARESLRKTRSMS